MEGRGSRAHPTRWLRAQIPPVEVDDRFLAALCDLAASSVPSAGPSARRSTIRVQIAAAAASVALISGGAAVAANHLGNAPQAPTPEGDPRILIHEPSHPVAPVTSPKNDSAGNDSAETDSGRADEGKVEHRGTNGGRVEHSTTDESQVKDANSDDGQVDTGDTGQLEHGDTGDGQVEPGDTGDGQVEPGDTGDGQLEPLDTGDTKDSASPDLSDGAEEESSN
jgi:hypothetical protein